MKKGAEGIILNNPTSFYEKKRTWTMLKLKNFEDFEAIVKEKNKRKVKRGIKRELIMEIEESGKRFVLRSGVNERVFKCMVGQKITIKCQRFDKDGLPVRPVFMRVYKKI